MVKIQEEIQEGIQEENTPPAKDAEQHHASPRDSKGWDGKLRVERHPVMTNPEAISDPEYSDEENVLPGDQIDADEGMRVSSTTFPFDTKPSRLTGISRSP